MDNSYDNFIDYYTLNYGIIKDNEFSKDNLEIFNVCDVKNKILQYNRKNRWFIYYKRIYNLDCYYYIFIDNHGELYQQIYSSNYRPGSECLHTNSNSTYNYRLTDKIIQILQKELSGHFNSFGVSKINEIQSILKVYQKNAEDYYKIIEL